MRKLAAVLGITFAGVAAAYLALRVPSGDAASTPSVAPERVRERARAELEADPRSERPERRAATVVVAPASRTGRATCTVITFDRDGQLLPRSHVIVRSSSADFVVAARTDEDARVNFDVPAMVAFRIEVDDRLALDELTPLRCAPVDVAALVPGEERDVELVFGAGCEHPFRARFVRAEDGQPAGPGALRAPPWTNSDAPVRALIDAEGRTSMCPAQARGFALATLPGRGPRLVAVGNESEFTRPEVVVKLEASATLVARIVDNGTWSSSPYVLHVGMEARALLDVAQRSAAPAARLERMSCRFEVPPDEPTPCAELPPGVALSIDLTRDGRALRYDAPPLVLAPGETREILIDLRERVSLRVHVVDDAGSALADRHVRLVKTFTCAGTEPEPYLAIDTCCDGTEAAGVTDAAGTCTLVCVEPGAWWLVAPTPDVDEDDRPYEHDVVSVARRIVVAEHIPSSDVTFVAPRAKWLRGRVELADGRPLSSLGDRRPRVVLGVVNVHGAQRRAEPDRSGEFTIGPLLDGEYVLRTWGDCAPTAPLRVRPGGEPVVVRIERGGDITGRVIGSSGQLSRWTRVYASRVSGAGEARSTRIADDGTYHFESLAPGEYVLAANTHLGEFGARSAVVVASGETRRDVDLVLARLAPAQVTFERGELTEATVAVWCEGVCWAEVTGDPDVLGPLVPAGRIEARLLVRGECVETRAIELDPGGRGVVEFSR